DNYFFYFSGENEKIPLIECLAILEVERIRHRIIDKLKRILIIHTDEVGCKKVTSRAAYTYSSFKLILSGVLRGFNLKKEMFGHLNIDKDKTFSVRFKRITTGCGSKPDILKLEKEIGHFIKHKLQYGLKVNLDNPDYQFVGFIIDNKVIFGLKTSEADRRSFTLRQGQNLPCFHPGVMHPKLSRAMVNLSRIRKGDLFLDPFIGTGGITIEAGLIGCRVVGVELSKKMIYCSMKNLRKFKVMHHLLYGDSRYLPVNHVDGGATDPPYGISTSTHGRSLSELITVMLGNIEDVLKPKSYFTFAIPSTLKIEELLNNFKLKIIDIAEIYVHKSLTRNIIIVRR
ncbi:MAG: THUMP domain-containing protein, partial [Candidatus Odinarchaeia archaeon]